MHRRLNADGLTTCRAACKRPFIRKHDPKPIIYLHAFKKNQLRQGQYARTDWGAVMAKDKRFNGKRRTAMLLCDVPQRRAELSALAVTCNCEIVYCDLETEPEALPYYVDFLMIDISSTSDHPQQSLTKIARYLDEHRSSAIVWTDMEGLETVYASLPSKQCHFFVGANDIEAMPILMGAYGREIMDQVHGKDRDIQFGALHRISDELAGFARTLARIAEQDDEDSSRVADKPVSFRPAPAGAFQPFPTAVTDEKVDISANMVREMIKLRRLRDSYFQKDLFADPAWDILLDLMVSQLEGRNVSVSSLCIAAAVPATTALRWIAAMTESGMLVRRHDPDDARRVFIGLSREAENMLRQYLTDAQQRSASSV